MAAAVEYHPQLREPIPPPRTPRRRPVAPPLRAQIVVLPQRVLIVSADAALVAACRTPLLREGVLLPMLATSLGEAEAAILDPNLSSADLPIAAMILDATPDADAVQTLCARLRQRGAWMPIVMLGATTDEDYVVRSLAAGADDYMRAPPRPAELLARLRALMRAYGDSIQAPLRIGPYDFLPAARILRHRATQRVTRLAAKEAALLRYMHRLRDEPVARDTLQQEIWGYAARIRTNTVVTHIYRLRRKIETNPAKPQILVSEGRFYKLNTEDTEPCHVPCPWAAV